MSPIAEPLGIALGPGGNIWSAEVGGIGRIKPLCVATVYSAGIGAGVTPCRTEVGADANLWLTAGQSVGGEVFLTDPGWTAITENKAVTDPNVHRKLG